MPTRRYEFSSRVQNVVFVCSDDEVFLPEQRLQHFVRGDWGVGLCMPYYFPGYRVGCTFIFDFPDVFIEFGVFLLLVFEGCFVSCVSGFESGGCEWWLAS